MSSRVRQSARITPAEMAAKMKSWTENDQVRFIHEQMHAGANEKDNPEHAWWTEVLRIWKRPTSAKVSSEQGDGKVHPTPSSSQVYAEDMFPHKTPSPASSSSAPSSSSSSSPESAVSVSPGFAQRLMSHKFFTQHTPQAKQRPSSAKVHAEDAAAAKVDLAAKQKQLRDEEAKKAQGKGVMHQNWVTMDPEKAAQKAMASAELANRRVPSVQIHPEEVGQASVADPEVENRPRKSAMSKIKGAAASQLKVAWDVHNPGKNTGKGKSPQIVPDGMTEFQRIPIFRNLSKAQIQQKFGLTAPQVEKTYTRQQARAGDWAKYFKRRTSKPDEWEQGEELPSTGMSDLKGIMTKLRKAGALKSRTLASELAKKKKLTDPPFETGPVVHGKDEQVGLPEIPHEAFPMSPLPDDLLASKPQEFLQEQVQKTKKQTATVRQKNERTEMGEHDPKAHAMRAAQHAAAVKVTSAMRQKRMDRNNKRMADEEAQTRKFMKDEAGAERGNAWLMADEEAQTRKFMKAEAKAEAAEVAAEAKHFAAVEKENAKYFKGEKERNAREYRAARRAEMNRKRAEERERVKRDKRSQKESDKYKHLAQGGPYVGEQSEDEEFGQDPYPGVIEDRDPHEESRKAGNARRKRQALEWLAQQRDHDEHINDPGDGAEEEDSTIREPPKTPHAGQIVGGGFDTSAAAAAHLSARKAVQDHAKIVPHPGNNTQTSTHVPTSHVPRSDNTEPLVPAAVRSARYDQRMNILIQPDPHAGPTTGGGGRTENTPSAGISEEAKAKSAVAYAEHYAQIAKERMTAEDEAKKKPSLLTRAEGAVGGAASAVGSALNSAAHKVGDLLSPPSKNNRVAPAPSTEAPTEADKKLQAAVSKLDGAAVYAPHHSNLRGQHAEAAPAPAPAPVRQNLQLKFATPENQKPSHQGIESGDLDSDQKEFLTGMPSARKAAQGDIPQAQTSSIQDVGRQREEGQQQSESQQPSQPADLSSVQHGMQDPTVRHSPPENYLHTVAVHEVQKRSGVGFQEYYEPYKKSHASRLSQLTDDEIYRQSLEWCQQYFNTLRIKEPFFKPGEVPTEVLIKEHCELAVLAQMAKPDVGVASSSRLGLLLDTSELGIALEDLLHAFHSTAKGGDARMSLDPTDPSKPGKGHPAGGPLSMGDGGLPKRHPNYLHFKQQQEEREISGGFGQPEEHAQEHFRPKTFMKGPGHDVRRSGPSLAHAPGVDLNDPGIYNRVQHDNNFQPVHRIDPNVVMLRTKNEPRPKRILL